MKLFECQNCRQPLYFENTHCESCGLNLGYLPEAEIVTALNDDNGFWTALAEPQRRYRYCANAQYNLCNWLITSDDPNTFCAACRHNRMIPDLSVPANLANWRKIESAKHRLFYTLLRLRLPLANRTADPEGLAFDFLAASADPVEQGPVMTGHDNGLITINLAEADDAERERQRSQMHEPYRTLLGHFRHEIAHYYWGRLVANSPSLPEFRRIFGDERKDYSGCSSAALCGRTVGRLAGALRDCIRKLASLGGLCRDVGALLPYDRHPGNSRCIWAQPSAIVLQQHTSCGRH